VIQQTYHCDGPDCERNWAGTAHAEHGLSVVGKGWDLHFCGWDCVLRYGATIEPEEVIYP
jgi:hypothetical protein